MRRLGIGLSLFALMVFGACGDCGETTTTGDADGMGGDGFADGAPTDGTVDGDGASSGGGTSGGGTAGSTECTGTEAKCDAQCVSVRLNPDHCGSCGNTCASGEVCNSGKCVQNCPYGMTECPDLRRCIDLQTNDDHCGECGNSCDSGEGCSQGNCVDTVDLDEGNKTCTGGGPSVQLDFGQTETKNVCAGSVAKTTFKWAMCSCDRLQFMNNVFMDAYDSSRGPYDPNNPGYGGGLGSNSSIHVGKGEIWGATWSAADGISSSVRLRVKQQMHSQDAVTFGSKGGVEGESWIGGDVTGESGGPPGGGGGGGGGGEPIEFEKTLHIPQGATIGQRIKTNGGVKREPVNVSTVCSRCKEQNRIPVRRIVRNHRNKNDNSVIGLNKDALVNPGKDIVLKLPCGRYFLEEIDVSSRVTILATGNTTLFVNGDINSDGNFTIKPTPSGEFDVFVNGKVTLSNDLKIGSAAYPANMRFYVNGEWTFMNDGDFGAYIYAIPGGISAMNNIVLYGGMYTQDYQSMNNVDVHFDREVLDVDKDCPDPDQGGGGDTGPDAGPDADADAGGGGSCKADGESCSADGECCNNLLCENGTCGGTCQESGQSCSGDGDCCSPLVCSEGTCQTSGCNVTYESCSMDGDCCSGDCATVNGNQICVSG